MKHTPKQYALAAWRLPWVAVGLTGLSLYCVCVLVLDGWRATKHAWNRNI